MFARIEPPKIMPEILSPKNYAGRTGILTMAIRQLVQDRFDGVSQPLTCLVLGWGELFGTVLNGSERFRTVPGCLRCMSAYRRGSRAPSQPSPCKSWRSGRSLLDLEARFSDVGFHMLWRGFHSPGCRVCDGSLRPGCW